jgi:aspartokinase
MALIVQKYGGTSVGTTERIHAVAEKIIACREQGNQLVVVVSAMSGETNRLLSLAGDMAKRPVPRELDVLLATGEQTTIALLSMALEVRGFNSGRPRTTYPRPPFGRSDALALMMAGGLAAAYVLLWTTGWPSG